MNQKLIDYAGQVFGELVVNYFDESKVGRGRHWVCTCSCGEVVSVRQTNFLNGNTKSCGHLRTTHGMHGSRTYEIWRGVMNRCLNPRHPNYQRYGARGLTISPEWQTFDGFFASMGECPSGLTIERKDGRIGYQEGNCIWATTKVQARNRSNNVRISFNGEEMVLADWCARFDLRYKIVNNRLRAGWTVVRAFTTPTTDGFTNCQT